MKAYILKISIIMSIITIIYLTLSYFGLIRCILLPWKGTLSLAEKYIKKSKSQYCKNDKIVVSMFSSNGLEENLKTVINSILDQSIKIDSILIFTNEKISNITIPKYIEYTSQLLPSEIDYKYGNNIIPAILKEKSNNVIIIPIKNIIYGEDYLETLLEHSEKNPTCQIFNKNKDLLLFKIDNFSDNILEKSNQSFEKDWFIENSKNKLYI
jgi:hypothetical protein